MSRASDSNGSDRGTAPFVELRGVAKRWNGQLGVENIDLVIEEGSFVALLGPSGCGKSTTLRLIAGLETADEGRIFIRGSDVTSAPPAKRDLSMVFQSYALFPHLTVAENVIFGLRVRRVPKAARQEQLRRALTITGLEGLEARKPSQLSGGQRQRVALARAIVADRRLCLMDEPLSNLDAKLRNSVRKDIKRLQRDLGMTVLYVTHDQSEAMSMADKVVLMNAGHVQQVGSPEELYENPTNTFAAEFIGTPPMALLSSGAVHGYDAGLTVGVRPEKVRRAPDGAGRVTGVVTDSEFLGAETLISLEHPSAKGLAFITPGRSLIPVGEQISVDFDDRDVHVFGEGGNRQA